MSEELQKKTDFSKLKDLPVTYQQVEEFFHNNQSIDSFALRAETMKRIESLTKRPLICYMTQTELLPQGIPSSLISIENSDIEGFDALIDSVKNDTNSDGIDVYLVSNGGSPETAERIVRLLRDNFQTIRFILPANAYSAATMMAFACDSVLMTDTAALGPIDPQINGIPARTILRGFQALEERLKQEGPEALAAYIHLLNGYSLHLLEICKSAEELAKELAISWLSQYMLQLRSDDDKIIQIVNYFADYDLHKSHGRSISYTQAYQLGLKVEKLERGESLNKLVRSLYSQYSLFFRKTPFFKVYENAHGTGFGRHGQIAVPPQQQLVPPNS